MANKNFLLVLFLFFTLKLFSQSNLEFDSEAITKTLYQHVSDDTPGVAVGIVNDGQIVYEQYLGYANLEHEVKIDKNTRFNIASNAKQFTEKHGLNYTTYIKHENGKLTLTEKSAKKYSDILGVPIDWLLFG